MKLLKQIKINKNNFDVHDKGLVYISDLKNICNDIDCINGEFNSFTLVNNHIYSYDASSKQTLVLGLDLEVLKVLSEFISFLPALSSSQILIGVRKSGEVKEWVFFNPEINEVIKCIPLVGGNQLNRSIDLDTFISKTSTAISKVLIFEMKVLWQKDINSLIDGKEALVMSEIIIHKQKLFFYLVDYKTAKFSTFCLNQETGEVLGRFDGIGGWLRLHNGLIYSTNKKDIQIINPDTFEVTILNMEKQMPFFKDFIGMSYKNFTIEGDMFFFSGERTADVGMVSLSEQSLKWHTHIKVENENNPLIRDIKANSTNLYVLDQTDMLHVFERSV